MTIRILLAFLLAFVPACATDAQGRVTTITLAQDAELTAGDLLAGAQLAIALGADEELVLCLQEAAEKAQLASEALAAYEGGLGDLDSVRGAIQAVQAAIAVVPATWPEEPKVVAVAIAADRLLARVLLRLPAPEE